MSEILRTNFFFSCLKLVKGNALKSSKYIQNYSGPKFSHHSIMSLSLDLTIVHWSRIGNTISLTVLDQLTSLDFQFGPDLNDEQFLGHCTLDWDTLTAIYFRWWEYAKKMRHFWATAFEHWNLTLVCALTTQFSFPMKFFFFDSMEIVKSFCFLIDCLPCGAMCAAPELPSTLSQKNQEMHFARSCLVHQNQRRSDGHGNGPFLKWA